MRCFFYFSSLIVEGNHDDAAADGGDGVRDGGGDNRDDAEEEESRNLRPIIDEPYSVGIIVGRKKSGKSEKKIGIDSKTTKKIGKKTWKKSSKKVSKKSTKAPTSPAPPDTPPPVATPPPTVTPFETIVPTVNNTNNTNSSFRYLLWDGDDVVVVDGSSGGDDSNTRDTPATTTTTNDRIINVMMNQEPFAYQTEEMNPCQLVDAKLINNGPNRKMCESYLNLPLITQKEHNGFESCDDAVGNIPKTWYTVGPTTDKSLTAIAIEAQNPDWDHEHYGDESAKEFILNNCGIDTANAYECLAPPAYRADLFRFCALYTKGGLYMDSDIMPVVKLDELYDPCAVATIGHDWPQGRPQKQMKILAGQEGAMIFLCMINKIVTNVLLRLYPENPLALTGPMVLHDCYEENREGVSITYRDTRDAAYPYSGMRGRSVVTNDSLDEDVEPLLALEVPHNEKGHDGQHNYKIDFEKHQVYRPTCSLHVKKTTSARV